MTIYKCFTKHTLEQAHRIAVQRNYNRRLTEEFIQTLSDDGRFPVLSTRKHEHAVGVKVDPHVRCFVAFDDSFATLIDVDAELFESLPSLDLPDDDVP